MSKPRSASKTTPTMEDLFKEIDLPAQSLRRGDVIEGKALAVTATEALIDVGAKSEGILSFSEFKDQKLKVGDKILVYVLTPEDKKGQLRLSLRKAHTAKTWLDLQEALEAGRALEATIVGHNKGGLNVEVLGRSGFIPFSHLTEPPDLSLPRPELQSLLDRGRGQKIRVICLEANPSKDRIILSEKLAKEAEKVEEKASALAKIAQGDVMSGQVEAILPYGVSVKIIKPNLAKGVEGLVEIEELAWEGPSVAAEALANFEIGQEVKVKVLAIDEKTGRVRFSIKQILKDPWLEKIEKIKLGSKLKGEVTKISSLGVTLRWEDDSEGLLPLNELPADKKEVKIGEKIAVAVAEIDKKERRLVLKMEV